MKILLLLLSLFITPLSVNAWPVYNKEDPKESVITLTLYGNTPSHIGPFRVGDYSLDKEEMLIFRTIQFQYEKRYGKISNDKNEFWDVHFVIYRKEDRIRFKVRTTSDGCEFGMPRYCMENDYGKMKKIDGKWIMTRWDLK